MLGRHTCRVPVMQAICGVRRLGLDLALHQAMCCNLARARHPFARECNDWVLQGPQQLP